MICTVMMRWRKSMVAVIIVIIVVSSDLWRIPEGREGGRVLTMLYLLSSRCSLLLLLLLPPVTLPLPLFSPCSAGASTGRVTLLHLLSAGPLTVAVPSLTITGSSLCHPCAMPSRCHQRTITPPSAAGGATGFNWDAEAHLSLHHCRIHNSTVQCPPPCPLPCPFPAPSLPPLPARHAPSLKHTSRA